MQQTEPFQNLFPQAFSREYGEENLSSQVFVFIFPLFRESKFFVYFSIDIADKRSTDSLLSCSVTGSTSQSLNNDGGCLRSTQRIL